MSKSYTVQSGDRLTRISQRFYGTPDKYPLIIQANPVLGERKIKRFLQLMDFQLSTQVKNL